MYTIYLAGPITGQSYDQANDWRNDFSKSMPEHITCLSPMRGKTYLEKEKSIKDAYLGHGLSTATGVLSRDRFDATRCDVLVVNFLGAKQVSIGTVMEVAWADLSRTPIIIVIEEGNVHKHKMLLGVAGFVVGTLDEAKFLVKQILTP
jgi:hypothetical protein